MNQQGSAFTPNIGNNQTSDDWFDEPSLGKCHGLQLGLQLHAGSPQQRFHNCPFCNTFCTDETAVLKAHMLALHPILFVRRQQQLRLKESQRQVRANAEAAKAMQLKAVYELQKRGLLLNVPKLEPVALIDHTRLNEQQPAVPVHFNHNQTPSASDQHAFTHTPPTTMPNVDEAPPDVLPYDPYPQTPAPVSHSLNRQHQQQHQVSLPLVVSTSSPTDPLSCDQRAQLVLDKLQSQLDDRHAAGGRTESRCSSSISPVDREIMASLEAVLKSERIRSKSRQDPDCKPETQGHRKNRKRKRQPSPKKKSSRTGKSREPKRSASGARQTERSRNGSAASGSTGGRVDRRRERDTVRDGSDTSSSRNRTTGSGTLSTPLHSPTSHNQHSPMEDEEGQCALSLPRHVTHNKHDELGRSRKPSKVTYSNGHKTQRVKQEGSHGYSRTPDTHKNIQPFTCTYHKQLFTRAPKDKCKYFDTNECKYTFRCHNWHRLCHRELKEGGCTNAQCVFDHTGYCRLCAAAGVPMNMSLGAQRRTGAKDGVVKPFIRKDHPIPAHLVSPLKRTGPSERRRSPSINPNEIQVSGYRNLGGAGPRCGSGASGASRTLHRRRSMSPDERSRRQRQASGDRHRDWHKARDNTDRPVAAFVNRCEEHGHLKVACRDFPLCAAGVVCRFMHKQCLSEYTPDGCTKPNGQCIWEHRNRCRFCDHHIDINRRSTNNK